MDEQRFDQLTRSLARGKSRRGVLKGIVGVLGGALGLGAVSTTTTARTRADNGATCDSPRDCASGLCVDGVCCDAACPGPCEACNVSGLEGTCSPVTGQPVGNRGPCPGDGGVCSGQCDGVTTSSCAGYPAGETVCGETSCADGWQSSSVCSGNGLCISSPTHCGLYACAPDGSACLSACASDSDCLGDAFCAEGVCQGDLALGSVCAGADQCQSGQCVDGVCCDTACDGVCQSCGDGFCADDPNGETCDGGNCCHGACLDLASDPVNCGACGHACPGVDNGEPVCVNGQCAIECHPEYTRCGDACIPVGDCCAADECPQTSDDVCAGAATCVNGECGFEPVDETITCRNAICVNDAVMPGANCDGESTTCPEAEPVSCYPYACDEGSCKTSCVSNADCSGGTACTTIGSDNVCAPIEYSLTPYNPFEPCGENEEDPPSYGNAATFMHGGGPMAIGLQGVESGIGELIFPGLDLYWFEELEPEEICAGIRKQSTESGCGYDVLLTVEDNLPLGFYTVIIRAQSWDGFADGEDAPFSLYFGVPPLC